MRAAVRPVEKQHLQPHRGKCSAAHQAKWPDHHPPGRLDEVVGCQLATDRDSGRLNNERTRGEGYEYGDGDPDLQEVIGQEIARAIMEHRQHWGIGQSAARSSLSVEEPVNDKPQWGLLADIYEEEWRINVPDKAQPFPWKPVTASWTNWVFGDSAARPAEVTLRFDHRISQRSLVAQIRAIWPRLLKGGFVRQTRPLKLKAVALVRLICLEMPPGTTWEKRLAVWNRRHGRKQDDQGRPWKYGGVYPFQRDFRRAERQLTGEAYGLEYLYNPIARLTEEELTDRCKGGDRQALAYRERLRKRTTERVDAKRRVEAYALKARRRSEG